MILPRFPGAIRARPAAGLFADMRASLLSHDEQQMAWRGALAAGVARADMTVAEPAAGRVRPLFMSLGELIRSVRAGVTAVERFEQDLCVALELVDGVHVLGAGRIVFSGSPDELRSRRDVLADHLGA